ncbi:MAG: NYN domain-containing protein [Bacillaceae bacterium]|nr:NYN domain-containing protein [Bacillaceae bacterium]
MREDILIVDGYNIIGAWPSLQKLKQESLEDARDELLSRLAEYQAFTGMKVIVVFDAHQVPGAGRKQKEYRLEVYYTRENETADERIEKLVKQLNARHRQIYVATSDYTEQHVIFGSGALRLSARELLINVENMDRQIRARVKETRESPEKNKIPLNEEIEKIFEKWRRQK